MGPALPWPNLHKSIIIVKYVKLIFLTLLDFWYCRPTDSDKYSVNEMKMPLFQQAMLGLQSPFFHLTCFGYTNGV